MGWKGKSTKKLGINKNKFLNMNQNLLYCYTESKEKTRKRETSHYIKVKIEPQSLIVLW